MADLDALYMDDFDAWRERQIEAQQKHRRRLPASPQGAAVDAPPRAADGRAAGGRHGRTGSALRYHR